jgi:hypothetical protein
MKLSNNVISIAFAYSFPIKTLLPNILDLYMSFTVKLQASHAYKLEVDSRYPLILTVLIKRQIILKA